MSCFRHAALLSLCLLPALGQAADALTLLNAQRQALGVETAVVGQLAQGRNSTLPARVRLPNEQLRIVAAPLAGRIDSLLVAPGDRVQRGQILARLSSPEALSLQREASQASSQAALLRQSRQRDEQLFAEGLIAESRLQNTRAAASQAEALATERQTALRLGGGSYESRSGLLKLTAPMAGVVLAQQAQVGERVEASAAIYHIGQLSPLWLEIQAPIGLASRLKIGQTLRVAGGRASATLSTIGRAVDPASQTVLLRARLIDRADTLYPGQLTDAEFPDSNDGQPTIPASALIRQKNSVLVFVESERSETQIRLTPRPVTVVHQGGDTVTVDGLQSGEKIATQGLSGLKALLNGLGGE